MAIRQITNTRYNVTNGYRKVTRRPVGKDVGRIRAVWDGWGRWA